MLYTRSSWLDFTLSGLHWNKEDGNPSEVQILVVPDDMLHGLVAVVHSCATTASPAPTAISNLTCCSIV